MPDRYTATIGPALIVGHQNPHFDADGCCICFCAACSRVVEVRGLVSAEDCICPDCPCSKKG